MYLLYATFHVNLCSRALFNLISNLHRRLTTLQICHATLKQASAAGLTTLQWIKKLNQQYSPVSLHNEYAVLRLMREFECKTYFFLNPHNLIFQPRSKAYQRRQIYLATFLGEIVSWRVFQQSLLTKITHELFMTFFPHCFS